METLKTTWQGGLAGKSLIGCGALLIFGCLCSVPLTLLGALAGEDASTPAASVAQVPTAAPATNTPLPAFTPLPTDTPQPTPTPAPTDTPQPLPTDTPESPTATPMPPTATPEPPPPTEPPPAVAEVIIKYINYDGNVPNVESDEYAEIVNIGTAPANLAGWHLNAGIPEQDFTFPDFLLQPGQACRVYTNEVHPETCGFSFGISEAIWRNSGDCGSLFNASGEEISRYCF